MNQRDLDHRKTSCHAFIRGVIDFSTKSWDEAIRSYIKWILTLKSMGIHLVDSAHL
jgi:hypothetical protein